MTAMMYDTRAEDHGPSWILKPMWQWIIGTAIVVLFATAVAIPTVMWQHEQTVRSDGIASAAVKIECGVSAFVDKSTTPLKTPTLDPVSRAAANERGYAARRLFRKLQPQEYLSKCDLAPTPPAP